MSDSLWGLLLRRYRAPAPNKGSSNADSSKTKVDEEVREKTNKPQERGSSGSRGLGNERDSSMPPPAR